MPIGRSIGWTGHTETPFKVKQIKKFSMDQERYILKRRFVRKLRWVESGVNRWIMLQYWGAGHYFLILKGHHLAFRSKRFAAT